MAHFIVTFRFKEDAEYSKRYQTFVDRVREIADGYEWDETSSFFTFQALETAESLCSDLYLNAGFSAEKDLMVVIDLDNKTKATKGKLKYEPLLARGLGF